MDLQLNDVVIISATDGNGMYVVSDIDYPNDSGTGATVSLASFGPAASIGTANIQNNAVTYAKFQQVAAHSLVGNPTGSLANAEGITLGNALDFSGTTLEVSATNNQYAKVPITAAQWNGMYAAPMLLVAAPASNLQLVVDRVLLQMTFVSAQYANGGAVIVQYDSTAHGAGVDAATGTIAAATINGFAANEQIAVTGFTATTVMDSTVVAKGLYLSNATGPFITGDSTWITCCC